MYGGTGGSILGCVVEQIEEHLLEQDGVDINHWHVFRELHLHAMTCQNLARPLKRAPDNLPEIVQSGVWHNRTRLQLGHVQQISDETVEAFRFVNDGSE